MRIALLANLKKYAPTWAGMPDDQWDDLDSPKTIEAILEALRTGGHEAEFFEAQIAAPYNLVEKLQAYQPDLCFNIAEGHFGDGREAQIPALLEMLRIPYTGSQVLTLALALDKPMTKRVLAYHGLPTPQFQVFERPDEPLDSDLINEDGELRFPMFVKPSREGTGMGVSAESIVRTAAELREQVEKQLVRYHEPILVERYIRGREVTLGVIGNLAETAARRTDRSASLTAVAKGDPVQGERVPLDELPEGLTFFPALEVNMEAYDPSEAGLYTNRIKVELAEDFHYLCPAPLEPGLLRKLQALTAAVFRVTGCKDVARVDFRLAESEGNEPYILEVNPLPGLNPGYSDLCVEANAAGWTYEQLIQRIVELAAERQGVREAIKG